MKQFAAVIMCFDKSDDSSLLPFIKFTQAIDISQAETIFRFMDYSDEYPDHQDFEVWEIQEVPTRI